MTSHVLDKIIDIINSPEQLDQMLSQNEIVESIVTGLGIRIGNVKHAEVVDWVVANGPITAVGVGNRFGISYLAAHQHLSRAHRNGSLQRVSRGVYAARQNPGT